MILDAFIGLIGSIIEAALIGCAAIINLLLAGIEAIVGLFVSGFSLGRIHREPRLDDRPKAGPGSRLLIAAMVIAIIAAAIFGPKLLHRRVVATDGHSIPFAALILHTRHGEEHRRTDSAGNITVPRFGLTAISVKDPRYVQQTWREFDEPLVVKRTVLGSGLDKLADRLLRPAGE